MRLHCVELQEYFDSSPSYRIVWCNQLLYILNKILQSSPSDFLDPYCESAHLGGNIRTSGILNSGVSDNKRKALFILLLTTYFLFPPFGPPRYSSLSASVLSGRHEVKNLTTGVMITRRKVARNWLKKISLINIPT